MARRIPDYMNYALTGKYRKKPFTSEPLEEDEIRVAVRSKLMNCTTAAKGLLEANREKILITATGNAIHLAITLCERVKRLFPLHQTTEIGTLVIRDEYEPIEDGLDPVINERNVSFIRILLSKNRPTDVSNLVGYQPPIVLSEEERSAEEKLQEEEAQLVRYRSSGPAGRGNRRGFRGRGRGTRRGRGGGGGERTSSVNVGRRGGGGRRPNRSSRRALDGEDQGDVLSGVTPSFYDTYGVTPPYYYSQGNYNDPSVPPPIRGGRGRRGGGRGRRGGGRRGPPPQSSY